MNIGLNIVAIVVASYFNAKLSGWVIFVAIISMIVHYFIIQKYKKLAFEEVTTENLNNLNSTSSRLESLRWFSNWLAPFICFIIIASTA